MQTLHIVDQAYRATLEEQDDPVLWFVQVLRGVEADVSVLLRGSAVNYLVFRQDASGIAFGEWRQSQPPRMAAAIVELISNRAPVHVVEDDLAERGIRARDCIAGFQTIPRARIGELVEQFDRVWQW